METKNIQSALELLRNTNRCIADKEYLESLSIIADATDELQSIQSLLTVIEDFVESNDLTNDHAVLQSCHNDPVRTTLLLCDICDIVGYKD